MNEKRICPIDGTELTPFNQYELQDATICRGCAKKLGLTGIHQSISLANAAKALITLTIAKRYLSAGSKINSTELKQEYKSNVKSGDAPSGYQILKTTIKDAGNDNNAIGTESNSNVANTDQLPKPSERVIAGETTVKDCAQTSDVPSDKITHQSEDKITASPTQNDELHAADHQELKKTSSKDSDTETDAPSSIVKKGPLFWKGSGINGFITGAAVGFFVGIINMGFLHFGHLGLIVWIIIWLFMGMNPRYKETRSDSQIHKDVEEARRQIQNSGSAEQSQSTTISKNLASKKPSALGGLVCPRCHSADVQLVSTDANIKKVKTKTHVNANLNPLHPFRIANVKHETKVVKKRSSAKTAAALVTMGASTVVTGGTRSNKSREYHCQNCGKVFYKK